MKQLKVSQFSALRILCIHSWQEFYMLIWPCETALHFKVSTQRTVCIHLEVRPPGKTSPGKLLSKSIGNGLDSSEEKQNKHVFSLAHCSHIVWGMQLCRPQAIEVSSRK